MSNTNRPTTTEAVEAELDALAANSLMGQKHPAPYKLGACMVKLAEANRKIERLEPKAKALEDALDALQRCAELLDDYSDVKDGEDGPRPNRAMSLLTDVEVVIRKIEVVR